MTVSFLIGAAIVSLVAWASDWWLSREDDLA